jgi:hypothetical protein
MDFARIWHTRMGDAVAEDVELGLAHGLFPFVSPPAYVARATPEKVDYLTTDWWALFRRLENDLGEPDNDLCRDGKVFRRRFRLPFSAFYPLYETARDEEWFGEEKQSKRIPPLPLKIMGVFRLLGRNLIYDDIYEISKLKPETMRAFFRKFTYDFSRRFYDEWMRQPQTTDDIYENERVYRSNGYVAYVFYICCVKHPQFVGMLQLIRRISLCLGSLPGSMELRISWERGMPYGDVSNNCQPCHLDKFCYAWYM